MVVSHVIPTRQLLDGRFQKYWSNNYIEKPSLQSPASQKTGIIRILYCQWVIIPYLWDIHWIFMWWGSLYLLKPKPTTFLSHPCLHLFDRARAFFPFLYFGSFSSSVGGICICRREYASIEAGANSPSFSVKFHQLTCPNQVNLDIGGTIAFSKVIIPSPLVLSKSFRPLQQHNNTWLRANERVSIFGLLLTATVEALTASLTTVWMSLFPSSSFLRLISYP